MAERKRNWKNKYKWLFLRLTLHKRLLCLCFRTSICVISSWKDSKYMLQKCDASNWSESRSRNYKTLEKLQIYLSGMGFESKYFNLSDGSWPIRKSYASVSGKWYNTSDHFFMHFFSNSVCAYNTFFASNFLFMLSLFIPAGALDLSHARSVEIVWRGWILGNYGSTLALVTLLIYLPLHEKILRDWWFISTTCLALFLIRLCFPMILIFVEIVIVDYDHCTRDFDLYIYLC